MQFFRFTLISLVSLTASAVTAGLTVSKVDSPPVENADTIRVQQRQRDETGPTSFRFYAPRKGPPTKTDDWVNHRGKSNDGIHAKYYFRDRDLGQTFKTGDKGFRLGAITVQLQPVDVQDADPHGAKVSLQILKVAGEPHINQNGTTANLSPNGRSNWKGVDYSNPAWSTYASDWPVDPADLNNPERWPVMHYSDDYLEGLQFEHLALVQGGIIPENLGPNDYLRWEISSQTHIEFEPHSHYAFLFLFDEPAEPGVNRNIPLSNKNVLPEGPLKDPFPNGTMIRRDGASTEFPDVFIDDVNDPADVAASRTSAQFPRDLKKRLAIPPGTLGYPDVDTYRDMWFIIEAPKKH